MLGVCRTKLAGWRPEKPAILLFGTRLEEGQLVVPLAWVGAKVRKGRRLEFDLHAGPEESPRRLAIRWPRLAATEFEPHRNVTLEVLSGPEK